jgi:MFS transporter, OFA family, oxalate/formate antiporter
MAPRRQIGLSAIGRQWILVVSLAQVCRQPTDNVIMQSSRDIAPVIPAIDRSMSSRTSSPTARWLVLAAGTLLQLCLGTVYAWSYFQKPLVDAYGWNNAQVSWAFSTAIGCLGLTAACGGVLLPRFGPRKLAVAGGVFFTLGYLLAAAALRERSLPLLYLGYGVIGGCGLGLGYVTPVATVARWFPDRKGLATGIVIMGFGFGALVLSKCLGPLLVSGSDSLLGGALARLGIHVRGHDLVHVFVWLGLGLGSVIVLAALALYNPPAAHVVAATSRQTAPAAEAIAARAGNGTFCLMWLIFFCNIIAGIAIISFLSPLFQDLWRSLRPELAKETLADYGATLLALSSVFNGVGRMLWGGLSDRIGRLRTFRVMLASQVVAFALLAVTRQPWIFGALVCYVLLCYGGGFGTMPAFVLDVFGAERMAVRYGAILTAWSAAGVAGPQLVAFLKDRTAAAAGMYSFRCAVGFVAAGLLLSFVLPEAHRRDGH